MIAASAVVRLPYPFDLAYMPKALVACVTVGVFAPMIGTFLVQRRLSLIGDGIAHIAFAGIGAGLLLKVWPVWPALVFAVVGAVGVELLRSSGKASGDLALALFFYAGIALGVVLASRGGLPDVETLPWLFGDPAHVSAAGASAVVALGITITAVVWWLKRVLFAIVSDEDWARVAGLPVTLMNCALAAATAFAIIASMKIVGTLLVAALMALPVATAQLLAHSFRSTMKIAAGVGAASAFVGLGLSRVFTLSPGGMIVLVAAATFAVTAMVRREVPRSLPQEARR